MKDFEKERKMFIRSTINLIKDKFSNKTSLEENDENTYRFFFEIFTWEKDYPLR